MKNTRTIIFESIEDIETLPKLEEAANSISFNYHGQTFRYNAQGLIIAPQARWIITHDKQEILALDEEGPTEAGKKYQLPNNEPEKTSQQRKCTIQFSSNVNVNYSVGDANQEISETDYCCFPRASSRSYNKNPFEPVLANLTDCDKVNVLIGNLGNTWNYTNHLASSGRLTPYERIKVFIENGKATEVTQSLSAVGALFAEDKEIDFNYINSHINNANPLKNCSVPVKRALSIQYIYDKIAQCHSATDVLTFVKEVENLNPEFLFKRLGRGISFNGHRWDNENISHTGTQIYKMAKNKILNLVINEEKIFGHDEKNNIEKFLGTKRKRWGSTTTSLKIYGLFNSSDAHSRTKATNQLSKEQTKMKKWIRSVSPR